MQLRNRFSLSVIIFLSAFLGSCSRSNQPTEADEFPVHTVADTTDVGCLGSYPQSRIVVGPEVSSPDGRFTAQVEIEIDSRLALDPDAVPPCLHTTRVDLIGGAQAEPLTVHLKLPRDEAGGNTAWIVDWSADSRYLLFGDAEWQYEADYSGQLYWLYDTQQGERRAINHEAVLMGRFTGDCVVASDVIGFAGDNRLIVVALPEDRADFELEFEQLESGEGVEGEAPTPSCITREARFLFDPATSRLDPMPDTATVGRYGVFR